MLTLCTFTDSICTHADNIDIEVDIDIDVTEYDKEIHYCQNILSEYEEYTDNIKKQLTQYLKRDIQMQSQIDSLFEKREYMDEMCEKAQESLQGAEEAKKKYIEMYKKYR